MKTRGAIQLGTYFGREAPQENDVDLDALSLLYKASCFQNGNNSIIRLVLTS